MNHFWKYARLMLRYKRLIIIGMVAAFFDALCASGGVTSLIYIIKQIFGEQRTIQDIVLETLADKNIQSYLGDLTHLVEYIPPSQFGGFAFLITIILTLAILGSCFRFIHQLCSIIVSLRSVMEVRKRVYHHLVHVPLELMVKEGMADKLSRLVRDCNELSRGFVVLMAKAVRNILFGTAMIIIAFFINWELTAVFVLGLPILAVLLKKFGKRIRRATRNELKAYGSMVGAVQESLQAPQVVKVHQAEGYERRRYNTINRKVLAWEMKARTVRALQSPVIELAGMMGVMVVALLAAWYLYNTGHSPEYQKQIAIELLAVLIALGMAGAKLRPLGNLNNDLQTAGAAAARIDEMFDLPVEANVRGDHKARGIKLPRHQQSITFDNVTYSYPDQNQPAITDLSLDVSHGQTVAVVGPNGSVKSTLLRLLPRLINPSAGSIKIDDIDIANVNLRNLRSQIAVVTQQSVLFEGTIAENISYGQRHAKHENILAAGKAAYVDEFVSDLPEGYDTQLGETGSGLSGGQKQRICIARAVLRNPAILILDEATSQIDADSEAKINNALRDLRHGRTTFVIAHRLSTVVDADKIVVMQDGQIVDQGKHTELLERCNVYQTLTRTQL